MLGRNFIYLDPLAAPYLIMNTPVVTPKHHPLIPPSPPHPLLPSPQGHSPLELWIEYNNSQNIEKAGQGIEMALANWCLLIIHKP